MAFKPRGDRHAVVEVVFGLLLDRAVSASEISSLEANHGNWSEDLPRMERAAVVPLFFGNVLNPMSEQMHMPAGGIIFTHFKPDGNPTLRLRIENNVIFINCLAYTRWAEIGTKARSIINRIYEAALAESGLSVIGSMLEVVDVFDWVPSDDDYDAKDLFSDNGVRLTSGFLDRGPLFHHYEGWYQTTDLPPEAGRKLERVHIDSQEYGESYSVKFDCFQQLDHIAPVAIGDYLAANGACDKLFDFLHDSNKRILGEYITQEMAVRIKLNDAVA